MVPPTRWQELFEVNPDGYPTEWQGLPTKARRIILRRAVTLRGDLNTPSEYLPGTEADHEDLRDVLLGNEDPLNPNHLAHEELLHFLRKGEYPEPVLSVNFPVVPPRGRPYVASWNIARARTCRNQGRVSYSLHGTNPFNANAICRPLKDEPLRSAFRAAIAASQRGVSSESMPDLLVGLSLHQTSGTDGRQLLSFMHGPSGSLALALGLLAIYRGEQHSLPFDRTLFTGDVRPAGQIAAVGQAEQKLQTLDDGFTSLIGSFEVQINHPSYTPVDFLEDAYQCAKADALVPSRHRKVVQGFMDVERNRHRFIEVPNFKGHASEIEIEQIYVDVPLFPRGNEEAQLQDAATYQEKVEAEQNKRRQLGMSGVPIPAMTIKDVIGSEKNAVILGHPGTGKSTLQAWISLQAIKGCKQELGLDSIGNEAPSVKLVPPRIPIVIRCRDLAGSGLFKDGLFMSDGKSPLEALLHFGLLSGGYYIADQVKPVTDQLAAIGQSKRLLLLIDGLDEVGPNREDFSRILKVLAGQETVRIIVTSRVSGFDRVRRYFEQFDQYHVGELKPDHRVSFVDKWQALFPSASTAQVGNRTLSLRDAVTNYSQTASLATNILLLTLICAEFGSGEALPSSRPELYDRFVQRAVQNNQVGRNRLDYDEVREALMILANHIRYRVRIDGGTDSYMISRGDAVKALAQSSTWGDAAATRKWLQNLMGGTGLLCERGDFLDPRTAESDQLIQFWHASFQEYFAGTAIRQGYASQEFQRLDQYLQTMELDWRTFTYNGTETRERIFSGASAEYLRHFIEGLPARSSGHPSPEIKDLSIDEALMGIRFYFDREPFAVAAFALDCISKATAKVNDTTLRQFVNLAIDHFQDTDFYNNDARTVMDEVFPAVAKAHDYGPKVVGFLLDRIENWVGDGLAVPCRALMTLGRASGDQDDLELISSKVGAALENRKPREMIYWSSQFANAMFTCHVNNEASNLDADVLREIASAAFKMLEVDL